MDETATPIDDFCAALDCITDEAMEYGASFVEVIGALTVKAQAMGMAVIGLFDDEPAESDEDEEV